jgi:quinol monooxygenase YgiN
MNRQILTFVSTLLVSAVLGTGNSYAQNSKQNKLSTSKTTEKMIVVKVTYTVNDEYVNTNKELIQAFLTDFKKLDQTQFLYSIFQTADGKTFIHTSQYKNKDIQQILLNTPSFLHFQEQRDKNLASEPTIEFLNYVGASKEVF